MALDGQTSRSVIFLSGILTCQYRVTAVEMDNDDERTHSEGCASPAHTRNANNKDDTPDEGTSAVVPPERTRPTVPLGAYKGMEQSRKSRKGRGRRNPTPTPAPVEPHVTGVPGPTTQAEAFLTSSTPAAAAPSANATEPVSGKVTAPHGLQSFPIVPQPMVTRARVSRTPPPLHHRFVFLRM